MVAVRAAPRKHACALLVAHARRAALAALLSDGARPEAWVVACTGTALAWAVAVQSLVHAVGGAPVPAAKEKTE